MRQELFIVQSLDSVQLDGYAHRRQRVCVEIRSRQGPAKGAQKHKVMTDMCKLLHVESLLGRPCRKILAVADEAAVAFLRGSWQGKFAKGVGIELRVVKIPEKLRDKTLAAQERQYR